MSRDIRPKNLIPYDKSEAEAIHSGSNKILFTKYKGKKCVFLMQANRLTSVFFPETDNLNSIYIGKVKKVVKSINACFVEISNGEICFLPLSEHESPEPLNRKADGRILEGDEFLVQIIRVAQKAKQATVSTCISISNDYFVLTYHKKGVYFSKQLLPEHIDKINNLLPAEMISDTFSITVRTKAVEVLDSTEEQLYFVSQLKNLYKTFSHLLESARYKKCFSCLLKPKSEIEEILDNEVSEDEYDEIVTDDPCIYDLLLQYFQSKETSKNIRFYKDSFPLDKLYSLNTRMEEALGQRIWLKCGGYLIIQPTEALTVIDVNSGKYKSRRGAEEETAFRVNTEAAEEIALQLRLRNLSGIIIVDFINMKEAKNQNELMKTIKSFVNRDKIKTNVIDMTPLGLVEITRKKIKMPLSEYLKHI